MHFLDLKTLRKKMQWATVKRAGVKGGKKCTICSYKYKHPFAYAMWGQMCPNNSLGWSFLFEPNCASCNKQMKLKSEACGWRSPSRQCLVSIWVIACFVFCLDTTAKYPQCVYTLDIHWKKWCAVDAVPQLVSGEVGRSLMGINKNSQSDVRLYSIVFLQGCSYLECCCCWVKLNWG